MVPNRDKSALETPLNVHGKQVFGLPVDEYTRCVHYHLPEDIIAIKFKCCNTYYPCYECHQQAADHSARQWPKNEWDSKAILCGACGAELSIHQYMASSNTCPSCRSAFNPNCSKHYALYFQM